MQNNGIPALDVSRLSKKWSNFALEDINITLPKGFIMGLIGKNGSGKTTLINCILNGTRKNGGRIRINGIDYRRLPAKEEIGFILDPGPFFDYKTILENGRLFGKFYPHWQESAFTEYLRGFELNGNTLYRDLSKGMKTKFQLAFALSHEPKLLIMDEPTGGMDPIFRRDFYGLLQDLINVTNASVLISTHITGDLDRIADYVTMLDNGKQVFTMTKEELIDYYPIIRGCKEDLPLIREGQPLRIRKTAEGFETMLKDISYLHQKPELKDRVVLSRPNLEEIMYFFSEPLLFEGGIL
jgi:ABC-2 type transport system ATP-binding protein